jgi:MerR family transcriptional regulator, light-induced transcriptional regulator
MSQRFTAQLLVSMSDALAGLMTHELFASHPGLIDRMTDDSQAGLSDSRGVDASRCQELADLDQRRVPSTGMAHDSGHMLNGGQGTKQPEDRRSNGDGARSDHPQTSGWGEQIGRQQGGSDAPSTSTQGRSTSFEAGVANGGPGFPPPFYHWKENFLCRVRDLAGAMEVGMPALFTEQWAWAKSAYEARGVSGEDLMWMLDAMEQVLTRELSKSARAEATTYLNGAREALTRTQPTPVGPSQGSLHGHKRLAMEYLCALLEGDRARAQGLVMGAIETRRITPHDALLVVLPEAQREIGKLWHQNESTIAEEHFVTATTQGLIPQIALKLPRKHGPDRHGRCVLISAVEGNHHDLGLRILTELMEADGWRAVLLGTDLPPAEIAQAAMYFEADVVALAAMLTAHVPLLVETVRTLRALSLEPAKPKVIVGGNIVPAVAEFHRQIGADASVMTIPDAIRTARELVGLPRA